ncbi:major pollen allergen Ole e 10-like [Zingiber officinale]|uniref:major pollen allergen Ole e 10-like n=1 Tax=Zingiber officinale TaxID=94328 RepID=UPI001C4D8654|nr:major pollen allergen Ole e 10-like [Zingiber officinale]
MAINRFIIIHYYSLNTCHKSTPPKLFILFLFHINPLVTLHPNLLGKEDLAIMASKLGAEIFFFSSFWSSLLLFSLFSGAANLAQTEANKTWCVAKPSSDAATLIANLNYACSQLQVNCSVLRIGCACARPNSLISHASVAMNLYYQTAGRHYWNCFFNDSALVTTTDPSFDSCVYAYI